MGTDSSDLFGSLTKAPALTRVVPVLVPLPVPGPYSYAVPEGVHVEPGSVVQVPVGPRQVIGVVWDGDDDASPSAGKAVDHLRQPIERDHPRIDGLPTGR